MIAPSALHPDTSNLYLHVRVLMGMIIGLGLTHLLRHFARIVENPKRHAIYWVHLVWALSMLLFLVHFWWWEFRLATVEVWTFNLYLFVAMYALLLYLLCALVFPEQLDERESYRDYFYARRTWFFGVLATVYVVDYLDTWVKGSDYLHSFGIAFPLRNAGYVIACIIAMRTNKAWYHALFAVAGLLFQLYWIGRQFEVL
jgi:hypothetical protein